MSTWEEIGQKWHRAQQMGWQAVQAAMEVGDDLTQKKIKTPRGEFVQRAAQMNIGRRTAYDLMRLALHRNLIEGTKPESQRAALALLPKVPRKVGPKQMQKHKDDLDKYESFAKKTAKQQAEVLALKMVKVELERLQNDAHAAVLAELKAVEAQLKKERTRIGNLMAEADEKRQLYQDLLNKRANGHDFKQALKILRQVAHPDRPETSVSLRAKAMDEIKFLGRFLDV